MKKRRKTSKCLNCETKLHQTHNFCPHCGQENTDNNISIKILTKDFFSNYFSLDSRFGRSINPFLFKPGELTKSFNEGKRVWFAHPVRLYLIISLIHFTLFSFVSIDMSGNGVNKSIISRMDNGRPMDSMLLIINNDSLPEDADSWPLQEWEYALIHKMNKNGSSAKEVMDSLHINQRSFWEAFAIKRIYRVVTSTPENIAKRIFENIPIMMLFILPLYALLLKWFFKKQGLYINHFIHSFHIHAFVLLLFSFVWLISMPYPPLTPTYLKVAFIISCVYIFFSFRKIYQQSIKKTIFKLILTGSFYFLVLSFAIIIEFLISLATI